MSSESNSDCIRCRWDTRWQFPLWILLGYRSIRMGSLEG